MLTWALGWHINSEALAVYATASHKKKSIHSRSYDTTA
jgi:hypothetical protein